MIDKEQEIFFKTDTKQRKSRFTSVSFSHPAKLSLPLQLWLILRYSKPGDLILDPMGGSGTVLVACALGRDVITVEIEDKFVKMQQDNWEKIKLVGPEMGYSFGKALILKGDARNLSAVLDGQVNQIFTSPPYQETQDLGRKQEGAGVTSKSNKNYKPMPAYYTEKPSLILSSPPYEAGGQGAGTEHYPERMGGSLTGLGRGYNRDLSGKPSLILSSPPYAESVTGKSGIDWTKGIQGGREGNKSRDRSKEPAYIPEANMPSNLVAYSLNPLNIGNLPYRPIDSAIFSPPYEATNTTGTADTYEGSHGPNSQVQISDYRESTENIGNLKSDNYLAAMKLVYHECFKVLKPGGNMVLVLKNFIREKKIIDLAADTRILCESVGFQYKERWYRRLPAQSFWRIIARLKCDNRRGNKQNPKCKLGLVCPIKPEAQAKLIMGVEEEERDTEIQRVEKLCPNYINTSPNILFEDVLVFVKPAVQKELKA